MASECAESLKTVDAVEKCPLTETGWNSRALLKRCSEITNGTCNYGKKLVYHCLPNPYRNESMEVCAPRTNIPKGTCPEYSLQGKRINAVLNCSALPNFTCPTTQYSSTSIIYYPDCLKINKQTQSSPDQSTTRDVGAIVGGIVGGILAFIIIMAIIVYRYKKSEERDFKKFISSEIQRCRRKHKDNAREENHPLSSDGSNYCGTELEMQRVNETRVLLVGKTGTGKSSTGNSILQSKEFKEALWSCSVTNKCDRKEREFKGINVAVIDTPGIFDTGKKFDHKSYDKMKSLCHPGPHAVIIVFKATALSEDDIKTLDMIRRKFGDDLMNFAIVLFTYKDQLDESKTDLDSFLSGPAPNTIKLQQFISDCDDRKIAFDNTLVKSTNDEGGKNAEQVDALLNMIRGISSLKRYMTLE